MALLSTVSRSNWNLEMLVFVEGGKSEYPEKNPRSRDENQQQTLHTYDAETEIEPGPHWWEASALTTAPSLLPLQIPNPFIFSSRCSESNFMLAKKCFVKYLSCFDQNTAKSPVTVAL